MPDATKNTHKDSVGIGPIQGAKLHEMEMEKHSRGESVSVDRWWSGLQRVGPLSGAGSS